MSTVAPSANPPATPPVGKPAPSAADQLIEQRIEEARRALWWGELTRTVLQIAIGFDAGTLGVADHGSLDLFARNTGAFDQLFFLVGCCVLVLHSPRMARDDVGGHERVRGMGA